MEMFGSELKFVRIKRREIIAVLISLAKTHWTNTWLISNVHDDNSQ